MCRIDYADSDGTWVVDPHAVKAAKVHKCDDCGRTIPKGESYHYGKWLEPGSGFMPVKLCEQCVTAGRWLKKVCGGHLWPGVIEELREHWDEEYALRSVGLGRLVLLGEKRWQRGDALVPVETVSSWVDQALSRVPTAALSGRDR